ncbi:MAG: TlpA disulfide reductase family protein [Bacteroidetes bacterium]|nr:TlpA disulfide reductase family protein [Bacteroidota bacterium]
MNIRIPSLIILLLTFALTAKAQKNLPSVQLKNLAGESISTNNLAQDDAPTLICFWATWCSPCKRELNNYAELYEDWQEETGVNIIAVSIDDQRSIRRVAPYVNSVLWDYEVLLDPNKDFARAMQVVNVPHTFLVNGAGEIVWQHNNYSDGDEEEVYEQLLKWSK